MRPTANPAVEPPSPRSERTRGEAPLAAGDVVIDPGRRLVTRGGRRVGLTRTEYALLAALAAHAGRVLTHRQLVEAVWGGWGPGPAAEARQLQRLRVYVNRLRHKLEADPTSPRFIHSESGVGYRLWGGG